MQDALLHISVAVAAFVLVSLIYSYLRFCTSPAGRWKFQVERRVAQLERHRSASRQAEAAFKVEGPALQDLRLTYLGKYFSGISVDELARHPNIGPGTVTKLREAGLTHLSDLGRSKMAAISGIGPAREGDLREALKKVVREAESRFDARACPEGAAFAIELERRKAAVLPLQALAAQSTEKAGAKIAELAERFSIARGISFSDFLFRHPYPGLTDEIMKRPVIIESTASTTAPVLPVNAQPRIVPQTSALPVAQLLPPTSTTSSTPGELPSLARFRAVADFGFAVARADGRLADSERRQIRAFLERRYALAPYLVDKLATLIGIAEKSGKSLDDSILEVRRTIPTDAWPELYQFAESVSAATGGLNPKKRDALGRVRRGLSGETTPSPVQPPPSPPSPLPVAALVPPAPPVRAVTDADRRATLEIAPATPLSAELIRRQYRLLTDRFDPEKFASHGPDFVALAAARRQHVEESARKLITAYNEPLEPPVAEPPADTRHNPDLDAVFGA